MSHLLICRLCLQPVCKDNFLSLENVKDMLDELSLNLNLAVVKDPLVCNKCAIILQNSCDFKAACVNKVDMKLSNSPGEKVCRFCLKAAENGCLTYLHEENEFVFILELLSKHIPEADLSMTKELIACELCLNLLKTMHSFILKCMDIEDDIKKYVELGATDDIDQIDLNYIQEIKPIKNEIICDNLKEESIESVCGNSDGTKSEVKIEQCLAMEFKQEEINIKSEHSDIGSCLDAATSQPDLTDIYNLSSSGSETYCSYQQSEYKNHLKTKKNYQSRRHNFKTRLTKHMVVHVDSSELVHYACTLCSYTAKTKDILRNHMVSHRDPKLEAYKCHLCPYNTKRRSGMKDHLLIHRNCSEVQMYNCEVCSFQTKYKYGLSQHMRIHKDPSEITMYKCEFCPFKSKGAKGVKRHMILHKKEAIWYTCDECLYKTKIKGYLNKHMVIHKDPSEVTMFKCDGCSFETKHRKSLVRHNGTLKDPSNLGIFKCPKCPYETKKQCNLKQHMKIH